MGYSTNRTAATTAMAIATALASNVVLVVIISASATMVSAAEAVMSSGRDVKTSTRSRMMFSSNSPRAFDGDDMARSIFYFYILLLLFVACLCSFHLMWKSPEETAIHVVNEISSVWEDDVDTINSGNNLRSNEMDRVRRQQIDVQYAIDRTAHLRKKLQLLLYLKHNHVEMVRSKKTG